MYEASSENVLKDVGAVSLAETRPLAPKENQSAVELNQSFPSLRIGGTGCLKQPG